MAAGNNEPLTLVTDWASFRLSDAANCTALAEPNLTAVNKLAGLFSVMFCSFPVPPVADISTSPEILSALAWVSGPVDVIFAAPPTVRPSPAEPSVNAPTLAKSKSLLNWPASVRTLFLPDKVLALAASTVRLATVIPPALIVEIPSGASNRKLLVLGLNFASPARIIMPLGVLALLLPTVICLATKLANSVPSRPKFSTRLSPKAIGFPAVVLVKTIDGAEIVEPIDRSSAWMETKLVACTVALVVTDPAPVICRLFRPLVFPTFDWMEAAPPAKTNCKERVTEDSESIPPKVMGAELEFTV